MPTVKKPAVVTPAPSPAAAAKPAVKRVVPKVSPRAGLTFEEYLHGLDAAQQPLVAALAKLMQAAAPGATTAIKWSQPVFESNGPFAYLRPAKKHVTLGFWRGTEIADPEGLLAGEGDRMKHMKIAALAMIPFGEITRMVKEALALNAQKGDPTKR